MQVFSLLFLVGRVLEGGWLSKAAFGGWLGMGWKNLDFHVS